MLKAVLLDVGGPILNEDPEYEAWERFLSRYLRGVGKTVSVKEVRWTVRDYIRRLDPNAWLAVLWHYLRPDVQAFWTAKETFRKFQHDWNLRRKFRIREGIVETISSLRESGYLLALAGNQGGNTGEFLRRSGITRGFAWELVSDEMGIGKPALLFFRMILDGIGVSPAEAVMVGDRLDNDVLPAKLLGMKTIRVLVGPYREQIPATPLHCPDRTISDIRDLPEAIAALT